MTIAVDIRTGRILGQRVTPEDEYVTAQGYFPKLVRLLAPNAADANEQGYIYVPRASVRLEEV